MPAQVTTRAQVNGHRFLIRRLEHALIRGDSRMIHDPMRSQMRALIVGVVIAVLVSGAAGVLAFFKPVPNFGSSSIMLSASDGTLFVRVDDTLHPALNLASARLIAGKPDPAQQVDHKFLDTVARGPMIGIVGAPTAINGSDDPANSAWTVCDVTAIGSTSEVGTVVLGSDPVLGQDIRAARPTELMLAAAGTATYAVYDGVRAEIDPTQPALVNALRLGGSPIRRMSPGLLDAFPLVDPITPLTVPGAGEPAGYLPGAAPVGSILETADSRGEQLYVALREGLQPISAATADIIRYSNTRSAATLEPTPLSPALISTIPVVHTLRVDRYPTAAPEVVATDADPVACLAWQRAGSAATASTRLLLGHRLPIPAEARPVQLASADGSGPGLDYAYLKPGTGEYVRSTGADPDSRRNGELYYVNDLGLRFHIADVPTATALGLSPAAQPAGDAADPQLAPWNVLSLLPPGPELSQQAALIVHDGFAADPDGSAITPPPR